MKKETLGLLPELPQIVTIPKHFEVADRPELGDFPLNVLFGSLTFKGVPMIASAVYEPDLESYQRSDGTASLAYYNSLNRTWTVSISKSGQMWKAEKLTNGRPVRMSVGRKWEELFKQLTMPGLDIGEPCSFYALKTN